MTGGPRWRRARPAWLARYVHTGVLARLLRPGLGLPGRAGAPPEVRVRQLFEAFAGAGVRYAEEQPATAGEQGIRTPEQVFLRPGLGNCLDLAVAFAGGCLDAGLHPMIVTLSPAGPGGAGYAIVIVWSGCGVSSTARSPTRWPRPCTTLHRGGRGWDCAARGRRPGSSSPSTSPGPPTGGRPRWPGRVRGGRHRWGRDAHRWGVGVEHGVDVGLARDPTVVYPLPGWPERDPLEPPYHPPAPDGTDLGPRHSVRARNRIVPFEPGQALEELYAWCLAPDSAVGESRLRLMVVHGVGGSGKTRLAAELAARLSDTDRWYTGFLRRDLTRPGAPTDELVWLSGVVGPVLLVVDYVEATDRRALTEALAVLATRRDHTVVLLTARYPGDWRTSLDNELGSRGVHPQTRPDTPLHARHPRIEVVYRRAYRRFSPTSGAPDLPPELPAASTRWTTLDVAMLGWLAARHPRARLPADRATLYEQILGREFDNWNADLRSRFGREADPAALRRAAAMVSLLSPPTPDGARRAASGAHRGADQPGRRGDRRAARPVPHRPHRTGARAATRPAGRPPHHHRPPPGRGLRPMHRPRRRGSRPLRRRPGGAAAGGQLHPGRADQNPATAGTLATATLRGGPRHWAPCGCGAGPSSPPWRNSPAATTPRSRCASWPTPSPWATAPCAPSPSSQPSGPDPHSTPISTTPTHSTRPRTRGTPCQSGGRRRGTGPGP
ncbi:MAG: ATP-binding protein [Pseudonocardiales bacterium]|nr:ATP-binding protein [Pseudonocardiales bacterium]MBV9029108.1 ATP-binding protein [Pseudonocardiales bacterium]MBW0009417.1 ATP-binding protein [Pseudonocardiales bacterium]